MAIFVNNHKTNLKTRLVGNVYSKSTDDPDGIWDGSDPNNPPTISNISGGTTHKSTGIITGFNFSTRRNSTQYFTDFSGGVVGQSVVAGTPFLSGDTGLTPNNYLYSNDTPLFGNRIARASPQQTNFGEMFITLGGVDEFFCEFIARTVKQDYTSSPDAPQIKFVRLHSTEAHGTMPYLGITQQNGEQNTLMVTAEATPSVAGLGYPDANPSVIDGIWDRHTLYLKVSTPGEKDGKRFYRTSLVNQWTIYGEPIFSHPDTWDEEPSTTRALEHAGRKLDTMRFPFFQRSQQSTTVDINYIIAGDTLERVFLSTSPTLTASTNFKYITCPTVNRTSTSLEFISLIDALPTNQAVYAYVVNANNKINTTGVLVRGAL